ncbi:MAG: dUTP diphosphatase [Acholeplasmataceae bacterium]|jgi:dUTP pyrophosphatase
MRKFEVIKEYLDKEIKIPERATKNSAGYDLSSAEDVLIKPKEIVLIKTGLKVSIPEGEVLLVFPRSSLAMKRGLMMSNGVGVVDSDYYNNPNNEGHLMIPLYNFTDQEVLVKKGERVSQGIFVKYGITIDDEVSNNNHRTGGFGSSGK